MDAPAEADISVSRRAPFILNAVATRVNASPAYALLRLEQQQTDTAALL